LGLVLAVAVTLSDGYPRTAIKIKERRRFRVNPAEPIGEPFGNAMQDRADACSVANLIWLGEGYGPAHRHNRLLRGVLF
jgi:hypothetical protein